ncbi:TonB-dependent receptor [Occallatibacter riparius]|uniref:Carboxypeptidase-like regulatory domain-containing protein n=1 Tax=Occallatibacter riparius TaxID=1002689 RepID=A0A9J7BLT3_9BACT|nr:carboxypeptidase-like regulatory domain-containing protein [Occallatibacter riparius]UWZ83844.1 carboxypeptidase-like regulatory domain-containing protein [Occallatibacter riparius]
MISLRKLYIPAFLLSLLVALPAAAQIVGGTISGTVHDPSGAALSGASVIVRQVETGATRTLTTSPDGRFYAPSVPVGHYSVSVKADGFDPQQRSGFDLTVGQSLSVDFVLGIANVEQQVEVDAAGEAINTSTQSVSGLVDERQVKELPLNGRSYDQLITLNPGTVNYTGQRSGGTGTSNSSVGNMFSVSGRRPQDNLFLLNGIEYTGASLINVTPGGTSGQLLGVDAVKEFNVVSDTYGASYGKRSGAQVSVITTSGTNNLHGTAFEFIRNSAFDARNYFDQGDIPNFQRNQFGGSLGGPIRKNKLFLFGNYEGFRQAWGLTAVTFVPDNRARQGYLPNSSGGETYVGVDPSVKPLLDLWPVQNGPELGGGIAKAFSNPKQHIREDFGTARVDHNITANDLLFGVYTIDDSSANSPSQNPLSLIDETLRAQVASIQEQHVFSTSLLNTARFGYSRASFFFTGYSPIDVPGWVAGKPIGTIVVSGSTASNGASQITQAGTNTGSNNDSTRNLFTFDDHVYWTHGKHEIEFGGWIQRQQANDILAQNQYGQASFADLQTLLQGTVKTFTVVPSPTKLGWRSLFGAVFVEDTWKVSPRLELRAGFRFESSNGWNESQGRASNYAIVDGVLQTDPIVGNSALSKNRAKFLPEPRVGFAWNVWGNGKTAVHGGFGIYNGLLDTLNYRLDQTAPFNTTQSLSNVKVADLQITPGTPPPAGSKISPSNVQPDLNTPEVLEWNLRIEQQLAPRTSLSVGYVGSHSYHQILSADLNQPVPSYTPDGKIYYPFAKDAKGPAFANPKLANTTSWISPGAGLYSGFVADVRRTFGQGFQIRGNYTWSKNLDNGSAWNTSVSANTPAYVEFPLNPKLDWGPGATDIRNAASINASYELPFGPGHALLAHATGLTRSAATGWTVSSIIASQSGFPFTPQLGYNPTLNGDTRNPVRPNWNPDYHGKLYPKTAAQWFDPNAFLPPTITFDTPTCGSSNTCGTYGNVRRDSLQGPGLTTVDFSVSKNTRFTERTGLQFRAEFFNLLNHTNFLTPNPVTYTSATSGISPTAGVITATSTTSRQIQFGAKLEF